MACHIPPLKKSKERVNPLPSLSPIPIKNVEFWDGIYPMEVWLSSHDV